VGWELEWEGVAVDVELGDGATGGWACAGEVVAMLTCRAGEDCGPWEADPSSPLVVARGLLIIGCTPSACITQAETAKMVSQAISVNHLVGMFILVFPPIRWPGLGEIVEQRAAHHDLGLVVQILPLAG
jgi:hypothetical protein